MVDIGAPEVKALDRLAQREKMSRAALIRKAIKDFLAKNNADVADHPKHGGFPRKIPDIRVPYEI